MTQRRGVIAFLAGVVASLAAGWTVLPEVHYRERQQPLQFSHLVHTGEDAGMDCTDCHQIEDAGNRLSLIPTLDACVECHAEAMGETPAERTLVEDYVMKEREVPWLVYTRQPDHVFFSHATHVNLAELPCERCHRVRAASDELPVYEENRLTGYSRLISGHASVRAWLESWEMKTMGDCSGCHRENGVAEGCLDCHK